MSHVNDDDQLKLALAKVMGLADNQEVTYVKATRYDVWVATKRPSIHDITKTVTSRSKHSLTLENL